MTLARWPNTGFVKIPKVLGKTLVDVRGVKGCREGIFTYEGDRPRRWLGEPDIMLEGYWFWDWSDQRLKVESIDPEKRVIALSAKPEHTYGYRKGQWYYAYNLLSELDRPGEWYLDRADGHPLFLAAGAGGARPADRVHAAVAGGVEERVARDVFRLAVRNLPGHRRRRRAIRTTSGSSVARSAIQATVAVSLAGSNSGVVGCDIYDTGSGGVSL